MTMPGLAEPTCVSSSFLCDDNSDKDELSIPSMESLDDDSDEDSMPALEDPAAKKTESFSVRVVDINGKLKMIHIWDC